MNQNEHPANSNLIARQYLDSLLIETRYLDSDNPTLDFSLYGEHFTSPIMTAALSHLDHFMFPGAAMALAGGAKDAGTVLWYGMADQEEIDRLSGTGARMIEIIKPYADRDLIYKKLTHAQELGHLAVGIDIDHPFGPDGSPDICDGYELKTLTSAELRALCDFTALPLIVKGVLSRQDADRALAAGARGLVLSHHNNRIEYAMPPLALLPEISAMAGRRVPVFVDCEIQTGMDAFKALCLGAAGVCIGRPLMTAIKNDQTHGVEKYLKKETDELKKAMAFTGCTDLTRMDPTVIHRL